MSTTAPNEDPDRRFALEVVRALRQKGFTAYWAGGCVRDQLLGLRPKDYDVATNATPDQIRDVFGRRRTRLVGAAFGVVALHDTRREAQMIEVATFRRDATYSDGRHPDSVTFSTPEEDARRRDFTINGMFYDPLHDEVIDFVGGRDDLQRRLVRAIGDPAQRFREDKLRLLRAVRFAAAFDFPLEEQTHHAIAQHAPYIVRVSPERIAQEMRWMLVAPSRVRALGMLLDTQLLAAVLPELLPMRGLPQDKSTQPGGDLWDHVMLVMQHLREPSFTLALAALLHDVGKPATFKNDQGKVSFYDHEVVGATLATQICRRWKLSNKEEQRVAWLVQNHMYLGQARRMRWAKLQRMLTTPGADELLDLHEADALASDGEAPEVDYCREILASPPEDLDPPALVTGHDLIRHGLPPGKSFKWLLDAIRDAQLEKRVHSKRDALAMVDQLLANPDAATTDQASQDSQTDH